MAIASLTTSSPPAFIDAIPTEPIMRFSVAQFHEMIRVGILTPDDPVELLDGFLVHKMVHGPQHANVMTRLLNLLARLVPEGWEVRVQVPIATADSQPEPDIFLSRIVGPQGFSRHPEPHDIALIIEVADSSLTRDQGIKKKIYARAAIPMYWIVNLSTRTVEVYTDPTGPAATPEFRRHRDYTVNEFLPVTVAGQEIGPLDPKSFLPS